MNKIYFLITSIFFTLFNLSNSLESLYRAYLSKNSAKWFNQLMIEEPEFDMWLSTRLVNEKLKPASSFNNYYAEFRVKNETIMSKYEKKFEQHGIKLQLLVNDLFK